MRSMFFSLCCALSLLCISSVFAADTSCRLTAPAQDDVWVIVYDADGDGNRGKILWQGKIAAGKEIEVTSTDGHIRYDFTHDKDQPYEGDIAEECYPDNQILID